MLTDQITKLMVIKFVPLFDSIPDDGIIRITHLTNTGSAFGLFQDMNTVLTIIGITGLYIARIYEQTQGRPKYIIKNIIDSKK